MTSTSTPTPVMGDPPIVPFRRSGAIVGYSVDGVAETIDIYKTAPSVPPICFWRWFCAGRSGDVETSYFDPFLATDQVIEAVAGVLGSGFGLLPPDVRNNL